MKRRETLSLTPVETLRVVVFKAVFGLLFLSFFSSCTGQGHQSKSAIHSTFTPVSKTALVILGTAQDAGKPHIGCEKACCAKNVTKEEVVCLGLVAPKEKKQYLLEATPDMATQMKWLQQSLGEKTSKMPDGIFLTHAHIGHYAGLMYLGKEALHAKGVPVYTMPRMKAYLETNGPWSQLVSESNMELLLLTDGHPVALTTDLKIMPHLVPHRDEFSETVGYTITGPRKKALFIPDIDKWEKWDRNIVDLLKTVDYAFLDGTFYDGEELNHRDMSQIPHPFIVESMKKFEGLPLEQRSKIFFIHLNHTNPLLDSKSNATTMLHAKGFNVARKGMVFEL